MNQVPYLNVDFFGNLVAVIPFLVQLPSQEHQFLALAERPRPQAGRHSVPLHHPQRRLGRSLDVVAGARGNFVENQLFGHAPAHHHCQHILELVFRPQVTVFFRQQRRVPAHVPPRHDADFMHPVGVRQMPRHQRVPRLVVRGHFLFPLVDDPALPLRAGNYALNRFFKILHIDAGLVLPRRQQRRFVDQVRQVGAAESGCFPRHHVNLDFVGQRLARHVYFQDCLPTRHVRQVQRDPAVEPPRPQQRRVQNVRPVRGRDYYDVRVRLKSVHLHQYLVQRLLAFVVPAAQSGAAMPSHCVNLVNEHNARRVALRLLKQVPDPCRAYAHEHLHELAARYVEEGNPGLAGHGPRQQRLSRARRPH